MKRLLLVGLLLISQFAMSQTPVPKIVKDHYTVSGGLLGALNFNKYRTVDNNILDYFFQSGWAAGGWVNIPLSNRFSLEPELMYSKYRYKTTDVESLIKDGNVSFISLPVLLKWHVAKTFAITAGPQFDLVTAVKDNNNMYSKDSVSSSQISVNAGVEFFPRARVVPFVRYIYSFTDMNKTTSAATANEWKNSNIQAGVKVKLFGKHVLGDADGDGIVDKDDKCPTQFGLARYQGCPIPDADGDGINDEEDKCPSVAGLAKYQGCPIPDSDKDGINDEQDKCPQTPGLPKYQGCPIPDTDKDGINDEEDKCPQVPGLAKYQGCPIPDTDGDGINDEEDKCPTIAGTAENGGCPSINFKATNVQFVSGSATLTTGAKNELNKLVKIMNEDYPDVKMSIAGHTDNTGKPEKNQELSVARAESVKKYLVSKGVNESRLTATGFGQDQPIADNTTTSGKAKNRRVEFKVSQ
jgi:outer membrane protein OmpA-like peptidoglycan-associated protein